MTRATLPIFQVLAVIEALQNPRHPFHASAVAKLDEWKEEVRQESIKATQEMVAHARENMSDDEWSKIVD